MKVVIFEDSPEMQALLVSMLGEFCTVEAHVSPQELDWSQVDIIVTDNQMPGLKGIDFIRKFRSRGLTTPVFMFSSDDDLEHKFVELGGTAFFHKCNGRELIAHIKSIVRKAA